MRWWLTHFFPGCLPVTLSGLVMFVNITSDVLSGSIYQFLSILILLFLIDISIYKFFISSYAVFKVHQCCFRSPLPQLSFLIWRPPALPHRRQCSTIGRPGLNHRVRDGYGCCPRAHRRQKCLSYLLLYSARAGLSSISNTLCSFSIDSIPHMHLNCCSHLPGKPVICLYHSICALAH